MKNIMMIMAMCLMTFSLSAQQGQGGGRGQGRGFGINWDEIPGITAEQKTKIAAIETAQREEMRKAFPQGVQFQQMTEAQRAEWTKKMTEIREKSQKEIKALLTPEQVKVYEQKLAELEKARAERMRQRGQGQGQRAQ